MKRKPVTNDSWRPTKLPTARTLRRRSCAAAPPLPIDKSVVPGLAASSPATEASTAREGATSGLCQGRDLVVSGGALTPLGALVLAPQAGGEPKACTKRERDGKNRGLQRCCSAVASKQSTCPQTNALCCTAWPPGTATRGPDPPASLQAWTKFDLLSARRKTTAKKFRLWAERLGVSRLKEQPRFRAGTPSRWRAR